MKNKIIIELDEDIEPEFRLNLSNWLEDFNEQDLKDGKIKLIPREE